MRSRFLSVLVLLIMNAIHAQVNPPAVKIGQQTWMKKNLSVSSYRNGDPIPEVKDPEAWQRLTTGAWCHYDNDPANDAIYGKLYNWYAVNDPRGIAPAGWHIATDEEWDILVKVLDGETIAGGRLKETGNVHWASPNSGATNSSGFSGLPGGFRDNSGLFDRNKNSCFWWTTTQFDRRSSWYRLMWSQGPDIVKGNYNLEGGMSVRCIKDLPAAINPKLEFIQIGSQTWMKKNLSVTTFRNGDLIPEAKSKEDWSNAALQHQPAWSYYNYDPANGIKYGRLYNWYAVNDSRGLSPEGWHIPAAAEWIKLVELLGGEEVAGGKMKSQTGWLDDKGVSGNGSNTSGFSGLAGGAWDGRSFSGLGYNGMWWSNTENPPVYAWNISIYYHSNISSMNYDDKRKGLYVRCIKGAVTDNKLAIVPIEKFEPETVIIGTQTWMKKNLDIVTYSNGDPIPEVRDNATWGKLTTGAWCHYNNDPANDAIYGKLYNWYAINDPRGIAPEGWHVPGNDEWYTLGNYLGGYEEAGGKLKQSGTAYWKDPNSDASNSSGFNAVPGGYRIGSWFDELGKSGGWWTATEAGAAMAWIRKVYNFSAEIDIRSDYKITGLSVRLLRKK